MDANVASAEELLPEKIENKNKGSPSFHCHLSDKEIVHKIAQAFLPGLGTACVDNTTGDIFKTPGTVAVDIRTEMVQYLTQRSESFVAESVILEGEEGEASDHPFDIISDFVDDFASLKRNLFSRVSGWLLSDKREDKIDDFVQEMEISGFWPTERREAIAQTLLKNVDFKNTFHCDMKFSTMEELTEHVPNCGFKSMLCENEGCNAIFSASQLEHHDSVCPFKIIPCEQKCSDSLMRRAMDRHCITVCPMKLVNCPFYAVGCKTPIPQCMIEHHRQENLNSHLLYILQIIHKEVSVGDLEKRIEQLKQPSLDRFMKAPDIRSLTFAIKNVEATLGPLEITVVDQVGEEGKDDEKGEVNEEEKVNGEGKAKEEDKASVGVKVNEESKTNEEGTVNETGKANEVGRVNEEGKIIGGSKIEEEGKINEGGKADEEVTVNETGEVNEGKYNEVNKAKESTVNEAGKAKEVGKIDEEGKINEGGKAKEEGIVNETGKANEVSKVGEEGRINEGGKANDDCQIQEEDKINGGSEVHEE
ncbi:hypothetical protein Pint_36329 [Pistacia integerrima]|uniref:Uncharacterized protein n=1 Tax=Pistacia integerrima TaxID=434235 RepID=A0ACC0Y562_9ROSI|nr:hypothetical protein Pint_36329 [Pistacia integerrima]